MNQALAEWLSKAEGDFITAGRELRARKFPNFDSACYHCQQCAEKYLKAILQANDKHIPKTHYLLELLALILKFDSSYEFLKADLETLEGYSVRFRYPGEFAEKDEAKAAYHAVKAVREFSRRKLELKNE
jgi:HEPN domain-containing protein